VLAGASGSGMKALGDALEVNRGLTSLDLRNNSISAQGSCAIARGLRSNTTLVSLDLRWNDLGDEGGRAFKDCLQANETLRELQLGGNGIDAALLENIESLVKDRGARLEFGELEGYPVAPSSSSRREALGGELQLAKERAEHLEARLRRTAAHEETFKIKEAERMEVWQRDIVGAREEVRAIKEDTRRQLEASAHQMANLEGDLIAERAHAVDLSECLEKEGERRSAAEEELERLRNSTAETRRALERKVDKMEMALDAANEDRRAAQLALEHLRDKLEEETARLREDLRRREGELDAASRAARRDAAVKDGLENSLETAQAEVQLLKSRIDEQIAMSSKAASSARNSAEETRRMYEDRIESIKRDADQRAQGAVDRAKAAEYDAQRAEAARQASLKELSRVQVVAEERAAQLELEARQEERRRFDSEIQELSARLASLQVAREAQDALLREQLVTIEQVRQRAAAEARDFAQELSKLNGEMDSARDAVRQRESDKAKAQGEAATLKRRIDVLERTCQALEKDKKEMADAHQVSLNQVALQHSAELKALDKQLAESKARAAELSSAHNKQFLQRISQLEKAVSASLADAASIARNNLEG
jgi:chromosome segregation ATPase